MTFRMVCRVSFEPAARGCGWALVCRVYSAALRARFGGLPERFRDRPHPGLILMERAEPAVLPRPVRRVDDAQLEVAAGAAEGFAVVDVVAVVLHGQMHRPFVWPHRSQ